MEANRITWRGQSLGPVHDVLLFYMGGKNYTWNKVFQPCDPGYLDDFYRHKDEKGRYQLVALADPGAIRTGDSGAPWWGVDPGPRAGIGLPDILPVGSQAKERLGYATQNPVALLKHYCYQHERRRCCARSFLRMRDHAGSCSQPQTQVDRDRYRHSRDQARGEGMLNGSPSACREFHH